MYYVPKGVPSKELEMMRILDELYIEDPTRGTRRMCKELSKRGYDVGRTRRLMEVMRLKTVYCRPRTTIIDPAQYKYPYLLRNLNIERVNQVWAMDISYIPMKTGYMYLLAIIDLKSRYIVGWSLSNTMETSWVIALLQEAFAIYGKPEIINTDQGSQFTSEEYVKFIKSHQTIQISMDGKGRAIDNVYIERFFRTIKYEKLYLQELNNRHQVEQACSEFIEYYNLRRDHSVLEYKTPSQVYHLAA
ncbi:MAG: IS3 family transposase [Flavobacteriales bacterium]|nr:IS3 family transposase [Flavobacteriales bacterium]